MLLIQLALESAFDFGNLFVTTEGFLDPADHGVLLELVVRDEVVRAFKTDAAVCTTGVGAVISVHGVVSGKNEAVVGFALKGVDTPNKVGGHGKTVFSSRLVGVQPVE